MAAAYGSSSTVASGTRSNTTFTAPASIANGDFLLILMSAGAASAVTVTAPSGFSNMAGSGPAMFITKADPWTTRWYAFYKVASGESGNYATSHSSAGSDGIMYRFTGVDTSSPFNPAYTTASGTGSTSTATGLTTAVNSSAVIFWTGAWDGQNGAAPTGTTPTFTERFDSGATGASYAADGILTTAGATGNKSNSNSNLTGNPWVAALIALAAATGGGGSVGGPVMQGRALTSGRILGGSTIYRRPEPWPMSRRTRRLHRQWQDEIARAKA